VSNTQKFGYKCLTWNIYNLYIKYTLRVWQFPLLLALLSRLSIESVIHGRWMIRLAWHILWQCLCRWVEVNTTAHLSQIHMSSSRPSWWGTHESYHGRRMTFKQMFSSNSIEPILHNSGLRCQERFKFNNHQTWVGVWRTLPRFRLRGVKHGAIDFYRIVTAIMIITIIISNHKNPWCVSQWLSYHIELIITI
jgi:hypothetical protein